MGLSLLAPLALVLGALAALPLIAHLSRQAPRDRQPFGAMLLLERLVKRLRRKRRVKDLLLLLVRVLAVLAVVLAVSQLQWSYRGGVPEYGGTGRVVIVVDQSMSMSLSDSGGTLLARARTEAVAIVRGLPEGTLVGVVSYGAEGRRHTPSLSVDLERAIGRIEAIEPTNETSNLRQGLLESRRLLGGEPGEVFVLTDEAGSRMVPEALSELSLLVEADSAVIPVTIHADPPRNVAVTEASYGDGIEGGQVRLTVTNFGPYPAEVACEVTLPDGQAVPIFADLPPEGQVVERVTVPREASGGVGRAACDDPDLSADDARYFHLPRVGASRVLVVDGDPGDTPIRSEVYFLERALAPWGGLRTGVTPDVVTPLGLMELDPERHRVVFLANVTDPRPFGPRLTEFVRKGGSLFIAVGDNVTAERYNAALGGVLPSPLRKPRSIADQGEQGVPLKLPDTGDPLFEAFSRSGRASFGRVRASRVMTLEPYSDTDEVRTLLWWDNGMPALIERRVGSGRVLLWTSTVDRAWGNLPLQAAFMPLVQRTVGYLGGEAGGAAARFEALVGEQVVVPLPDLALEPDVIGPDGEPIRSRIQASNLVFTPEQSGPYELRIESAPPLAWVAGNTDPVESDVRRYDTIAGAEAEIKPELFVRKMDLSPWLFGLAMIAILVQGALALRRTG